MNIAMIDSVAARNPVPLGTFPTEPEKWKAVLARDAAADRHFFYSVKTTGVYCRPSCAARAPRRENVAFFPTREAAERAGFRPCLRCRPDLAPRAEREARLITLACRRIETAEITPTLADLAEQAGISAYHFHRLFKRVVGVTPKAYASEHRSERARRGLQSGAAVTETVYDAGFGSSSRFYESTPEMLGMKPSAYRKGGQGEAIRHAVSSCSLGLVLAAATERGLCAILLGDEAGDLIADLKGRFPKADHTPADAVFGDWLRQVVELVDDPSTAGALALPLDVRGTAFQRRVWETLRQIPAGQTASYSEVARRLGKPAAARAVAAACAANPLAVAVPCHRVVAADGKPAGYRWGLDRKRRLLERESK